MPVFPEYESMNDVGAGVPVLPLRRTFFPGASGLGQTPQERMSGGMPMLPLRRTFSPGVSDMDAYIPPVGVPIARQQSRSLFGDLGAGVPVLPLRRTFFPGASGLGQMPVTVKPKHMGRWVILDSTGKVVALIAGKIKKLGLGYKAKKIGEYIEGEMGGVGQQVYENQTPVGMGQDEVMPGSTPWEKAERYYEMNKSEMFGLGDADSGMFGPEPTERMSDMKGLF